MRFQGQTRGIATALFATLVVAAAALALLLEPSISLGAKVVLESASLALAFVCFPKIRGTDLIRTAILLAGAAEIARAIGGGGDHAFKDWMILNIFLAANGGVGVFLRDHYRPDRPETRAGDLTSLNHFSADDENRVQLLRLTNKIGLSSVIPKTQPGSGDNDMLFFSPNGARRGTPGALPPLSSALAASDSLVRGYAPARPDSAKWTGRARVIFLLVAAILSWVVMGAVVVWLLA